LEFQFRRISWIKTISNAFVIETVDLAPSSMQLWPYSFPIQGVGPIPLMFIVHYISRSGYVTFPHTVEWAALLRIREVPDLIVDPENDKFLCAFPQSLQTNIGIATQIMPLPISSTLFPVSSSSSSARVELVSSFHPHTSNHPLSNLWGLVPVVRCVSYVERRGLSCSMISTADTFKHDEVSVHKVTFVLRSVTL
jgi:hypothetical protein